MRIAYVRDAQQEQRLKVLKALYENEAYKHLPPPSQTEDPTGRKLSFRERQPQVMRRLPKRLVRSMASMLFGGFRFPTFTHPNPNVQAAANALSDQLRLPSRALKQARLALRDGAIAVTFAIVDGEVVLRTWSASQVQRVEWDERRPDRITLIRILYAYTEKQPDGSTKRLWFRRDYTTEAEVEYEPIDATIYPNPDAENVPWRAKADNPPPHNFGFVFGEWLTCFSEEDDDHRGESLLENMDTIFAAIDYNLSHLDRVLEYHAEPWVARSGEGPFDSALPDIDAVSGEPIRGRLAITKGDGDILDLGPDGTIKFVEMQGAIQEIQQKHLQDLERMLRTDTQVVEVDPEMAIRADSRPALERVYAPMLSLADELRTDLGERGLAVLLSKILVALARYARQGQTVRLPETRGPDGRPTVVSLDGVPDDPRSLSLGLDWGPYFETTAVDRQAEAAAVQTAVLAGLPRSYALRYLGPFFGVTGAELDELVAEAKAAEAEERIAAAQGRAMDQDIEAALAGAVR
ncbi:MAG TPA: hypothetical protein VIL20_28340 [Sandaracinaceae bacterium]